MGFEKIRQEYQKFGLAAVSYCSFYRLMNRLTFYKVLQGMTVTMDTLDPKYLQGNEKYTYQFLDKEQLRFYANEPGNQISHDFLDRALSKGDHCYAILDGDKLASYGWYSDQPTFITSQLVLHFDPSWIYMFKGYTNPAYRGQRLHAVGMARALQAFSERGYKGIISYVETNNYASLRSVYRMGYRNFGRVSILKLFNHYHVSTEQACNDYSFTVKTRQIAVSRQAGTDNEVRTV